MILYQEKSIHPYTIGGKAKGLRSLQAAGHAVPDFLLIPAETFDPLLEPLWGKKEDSQTIRTALQQFCPDKEDKEAITEILQQWRFPQRPVVVRSSVADEDGQEHAFPGMMDSFLNLRQPEDLWKAIALCAASAYSERAVAYRRQKGLTQKARPAVIIQQQLKPQASGVLFTTFPDYPQELAIHACRGFGEGLVQGRVEADEFYFLKKSNTLHRQQIVHKEWALQPHAQKGLEQIPIPEEEQETPCLSISQLRRLAAIGTSLERAFGHPQDIEFAIQDDEVFVLQARPITQPIPEVVVYDNSNIQESYCGVTSPLTFSFAKRAYATVYTQTMHMLGLSPKVIQAHEGVVNNLLGLVKGRIYYNINNWYKGLQLLPSFKQNKEDMERMMGLEEPVDFVQDRDKPLQEKARLLPGLAVNLLRLLWAFSRLHKLVPAFHAHFRRHYEAFYRQPLSQLSYATLLEQKKLLDEALLRNWTTPIVNDFYVMMNNGSVRRRLLKAGIREPEEFLSRYLSGDQEIESTQPTKAMLQLAAQARQQPSLQQLILDLPNDLHQQLEQAYPDFFRSVMEFIGQYGDRTVGELKLETLTMRREPGIFYKYLRNYLHPDTPLPENKAETRLSKEAREELEKLLQRRSPFFRRRLRKSLGKLQQAIRYRESMRLERTRLFGMYRTLYLAMGQRLRKAGSLQQPEDIFYLSEEEILQALQTSSPALAELVGKRKATFNGFKSEEVPSRVSIPEPPRARETTSEEHPHLLQGAGCYPGEVSGEVILIKDPTDELEVKGKIVCALRTDPGWAALFPACKGVLIEKGSSLSHSVILLRELGIPTIINIPGLTRRLQSGTQVHLDGRSGRIEILVHA